MPTYKFSIYIYKFFFIDINIKVIGSNKYFGDNDVKESKRPSWCDRILISSQESLLV